MRSYGSGSKRERTPGVWEIRAYGLSQTFRGTAKQAEGALAKFVTENSHGQVAPGSATFGQLIDRWLEVAQIEPSTRTAYEGVLELHLPAEVRSWKLNKLQLGDFDRLYARLTRDGVQAYPIRKLHTALSAALTEGMRLNWISSHPARGARLPLVAEGPVKMPPADALARLLAVARQDLQTHVWLLLALATGVRRSELLALRWSAVDIVAPSVTISASLTKDRTRKGTKTNRSRTVVLDEDTAGVLASWKLAQRTRAFSVGARLVKDPYVLSNTIDSGTPWRPDGATQRFGRLRVKAGVEGVRLYDLRHAHVSMLLASGIPVSDISPRVGHSRTSTTQDVYGHLVEGADRRAAAAMGEAIRLLG